MAEGGLSLVTGATSGIGREFVRQLAERGDELLLVARSREGLDKTVADLGSGVLCAVMTADLTDPADLARVEIVARERPLTMLVNSAGFGDAGDFGERPVEVAEDQVRLDVLAVVRLTHAALGGMRKRGRGAIVNVSSVGGLQPVPGMAVYGASKAFVSSFTQAVADEARGSGVQLLELCPGYTKTAFQANAGITNPGAMPRFVWMSAEDVVKQALHDLDRGKVVSIPGLVNRIAAITAKLAPAGVVRKIAAQMNERTVG